MENILNKCPICGEKIEFAALMQYSDIYSVLKNGKLSKRRKRKRDDGSIECGFFYCTRDECDFCTDVDLHVDLHPEIKISQEGDKYFYERI